jgi:hypothetical protein
MLFGFYCAISNTKLFFVSRCILGFLNVAFGNAMKMIIGMSHVIQQTLLSSILLNVLPALGSTL